MINSINDIEGKISLSSIKGKKIVVDDFLKPHEHIVIKKELIDDYNFPWRVAEGNVSGESEDDSLNHRDIYFWHSFFDRYAQISDSIAMLHPIISKLHPMALVRVRANLDVGRSEPYQHGFHHDFDNIVTAIYYVNSNDGGTMFEDGDFVESKANRLVVFDSNLRHTGQTPTDVRARVLININYYPSEDARVMNEEQL